MVKACRPRYRAVAAKSDPGDAFILADILRTDGHRLRPLAPQSDAIKALRGLVRGRDDLVGARVALANQLTALLESFWPGAARDLRDLASPIALAFLERYPTPEAAARLGPKRLAGFLAQHRYCGRRSPETLLERLRSAPDGRAGEAEGEAKGDLVRALARTLQALVAEIAKLTSRIEHAIAELPDGRIVMSFPRAGRICAAQILAELGDVRARFPSRAPARRRGRRRSRHLPERQVQRRRLALGLQQAPARRAHLHGRQLPPPEPLGRRRLPARQGQRLRPPARHPHPRPSLGARPLARLDRPPTLRPRQTRRRQTLPHAPQRNSG